MSQKSTEQKYFAILLCCAEQIIIWINILKDIHCLRNYCEWIYFLKNISSSRSYQSTSLLAELRNRRFCKSFRPLRRGLRPSGEKGAFERQKSPAGNHMTSNCGDVKTKVHVYEQRMHLNIQDVHIKDPRPRKPT